MLHTDYLRTFAICNGESESLALKIILSNCYYWVPQKLICQLQVIFHASTKKLKMLESLKTGHVKVTSSSQTYLFQHLANTSICSQMNILLWESHWWCQWELFFSCWYLKFSIWHIVSNSETLCDTSPILHHFWFVHTCNRKNVTYFGKPVPKPHLSLNVIHFRYIS